MARVVLRILFILSISLNIALAIHILSDKSAAPKTENVKLNLSQTQRQELSDIHNKIHLDNEALRKQIAHCQSRLMEALNSDSLDKNQIHHCVEVISDLQKKIQHNTVEEIIRAKKVLSREQCVCLIKSLNARLQQKECNKNCCDLENKK